VRHDLQSSSKVSSVNISDDWRCIFSNFLEYLGKPKKPGFVVSKAAVREACFDSRFTDIKEKRELTLKDYSQHGEGKILAGLLEKVDEVIPDGILVEFGGSRGRDNSNCFGLGESGRRVVLIEADLSRYRSLEESIRNLPSFQGIHAKVGIFDKDGSKTLRTILANAQIDSSDVSVVSIDIDSDDAAVFENLGFSPEIVVVEYNPTFPSDALYRNPSGQNIGNSPAELERVAANLGMYLVGVTTTNLFFAKNRYKEDFTKVNLVDEIKGLSQTRFAWGYDGTLVRFTTLGEHTTEEVYHNGWNDSLLFQPVPKRLRSFSSKGRLLRLALAFAYGLLFRSSSLVSLILKRLNEKSSAS